MGERAKGWISRRTVARPADFDITQHLVAGENLLAVEVFQYSDASYLEDQDKWRLSGIFRERLSLVCRSCFISAILKRMPILIRTIVDGTLPDKGDSSQYDRE